MVNLIWSPHRRRVILSAIVILAASVGTSVLIGWLVGFGSSGSSDPYPEAAGTDISFRMPQFRSCDEKEPIPLHMVGRLASGYTLANLTSAGFEAVKAIEGAEDNLVLIKGDGREFEALKAVPILENTGWIRDRAMDLSLRSCDYRLEDKPAAAAIRAKATGWMVEHGVLTQQQIDADGTTFGLQDDPTDPAHLFFTVLLAKPTGGGPGGPPVSELLTPYTATIDRVTGEVLSAGRAHWYDFY